MQSLPPISPANEIRVVMRLGKAAERALSKFRSTLKADESMLQNGAQVLSPRMRTALLARAGERRVLQHFADIARELAQFASPTAGRSSAPATAAPATAAATARRVREWLRAYYVGFDSRREEQADEQADPVLDFLQGVWQGQEREPEHTQEQQSPLAGKWSLFKQMYFTCVWGRGLLRAAAATGCGEDQAEAEAEADQIADPTLEHPLLRDEASFRVCGQTLRQALAAAANGESSDPN
jgi:hypothetical protein